MSSSDPHTGGRLEDMATTGTKIPNDAGVQRIIPSVARPDQRAENSQFSNDGLAAADLQSAADNAGDVARRNADMGLGTGEAVTGLGDQLPASVGTKVSDRAALRMRGVGVLTIVCSFLELAYWTQRTAC